MEFASKGTLFNMIYMEFASKGTIFNMISEFRGKPMPENMIGRAAFIILKGLDALHSHGYVHCVG